MLYCSIDIETTHRNKNIGDIIEIAAVVDDLTDPKPVLTLPSFRCYVDLPTYTMNKTCMKMHMENGVFRNLCDPKNPIPKLKPEEIAEKLGVFLLENGFGEDRIPNENKTFFETLWQSAKSLKDDESKNDNFPIWVTPAGKNVTSFDIPWLYHHIPNLSDYVRFMARSMDPSICFMNVDDDAVPNTSTLLDRMGKSNSIPSHNAYMDALDIIRAIRIHFDLPS